jgi:hypothetical protein
MVGRWDVQFNMGSKSQQGPCMYRWLKLGLKFLKVSVNCYACFILQSSWHICIQVYYCPTHKMPIQK